ncbi:SRPBCC family protein [Actinomadura sp. SCN-SB]|uniref:SRPBCC family protein n=1 Tax=Actinomadura sp. SCN-SB TaxID=3373092 RepID=UPI003751159A
MLIENTFEVEADPDVVFAFLQNAHNVAACFPGAELTEELGDDSFKGKVKVKLGPVTASFTGTATIIELDEKARTAVLSAKGKDARGAGTAQAKAKMRVEPSGNGSQVFLETDLTVSGRLAQFGRGIMADVSARMVGDMAKSVQERIEAEQGEQKPAAEAEPAAEQAAAEGAEPKATETKPAQTKPAQTKPAETKQPEQPASAIKGTTLLKVMVAGMFRRLFARLRGRSRT